MSAKVEQKKKPVSSPLAQENSVQEQKEVEQEEGTLQLQKGIGNRATEQLLNEEEKAKEASSNSEKEGKDEALMQEVSKEPVVEDNSSEVILGSSSAAQPSAPKVPEVEVLQMQGSSEESMNALISAPASQIAASFPTLGTTLNEKLQDEKKEEVKNTPTLTASTQGELSEQIQAGAELKLENEMSLDEEPLVEPAVLEVEVTPELPLSSENAEASKVLEKKESEGFLDWFKSQFTSFFKNIKTQDKALDTGAGETPSLELSGQADPERAKKQKAQADLAVETQKQEASQAFVDNPGQKNIQPKAVQEEITLELTTQVDVSIENGTDAAMAEYVEVELPVDVRTKADELLKPSIDGNLASVQNDLNAASQTRKNDKQAEIDTVNEKNAELNKQAQKDQEKVVLDNRKLVAKEQQSGINEADGMMKEFDKESKIEQESAKEEINSKSASSKEAAKKELNKGEIEAQGIKVKSETDAKNKKKELESKKEKKSWWDRAVDAIKSVVKAITEAIDTIFNAARKLVAAAIDAAKNLAVGLINAARNWIVDKLNKFRDWAKSQVNKYLKEHFPKLAAKINSAIDAVVDTAVAVVNKVADTVIAGVEALAKGLAAVLDKILSIYQTALKAAVQIAGAVLTGDFAEALKIAIQAACDIAGIDSKPIFDFFERAGAQIMKILKKPAVFFGNLMDAVKGGVDNFLANIKKHLINGLIGWLTGALSEVAITLPEKFDAKGIFSLVMQILGLTYENIKERIINKVPAAEQVFDMAESGFDIVKEVMVKGPIVLWEKVKESFTNFKEVVLSGIRDFVIITVVKEGITWLLSLLNPASAIVKALKLLFDFVMFLVERFSQIKDFVMSVYSSITAIAAGSIGPATKAVENSLARILPVAISLLASLAGLGGIGKTVQNIIKKVTKPINKVIDKIVDKVVKFAKKILGKGKGKKKKKGKDKKDKDKKTKSKSIDKSLGETLKFSVGKHEHRLWIKTISGKPEVMVASTPTTIPKQLLAWKKEVPTLDKPSQATANQQISEARRLYVKNKISATEEKKVQDSALKDNEVSSSEQSKVKKSEKETVSAEKKLKKVLGKLFKLFDATTPSDLSITYREDINKAHLSIKAKLIKEAKNIKEIDAKGIKNFEALKAYLIKSTSVKPIYDKPLSKMHSLGKSIQKTESMQALAQAITQSPDKWEKYKTDSNLDLVKAKTKFIADRVSIHSTLIVYFQAYIFDKGKNQELIKQLKDEYIKSINGNTTAEHKEYKPTIGKKVVKGNIFSIDYTYEDAKHAKKKFSTDFDFSKINDGNEIVQTTKGEGLQLKKPGRGKTDGSGQLKKEEAFDKKGIPLTKAQTTDAFLIQIIQDEEANAHVNAYVDKTNLSKAYIQARLTEKGKAELDKRYQSVASLEGKQLVDSAHLIADWFGGSGYKEALNLIVTSAQYNRIIMGGAEKKIVKSLGGKSSESIFDLTVKATWDVLTDSEIKRDITPKVLQAHIKDNSLSKEEKIKLAQELAQLLYKVLQSKQDPRRVLGVDYDGKITEGLGSFQDQKIGCDIWMSNDFNFDNSKCKL